MSGALPAARVAWAVASAHGELGRELPRLLEPAGGVDGLPDEALQRRTTRRAMLARVEKQLCGQVAFPSQVELDLAQFDHLELGRRHREDARKLKGRVACHMAQRCRVRFTTEFLDVPSYGNVGDYVAAQHRHDESRAEANVDYDAGGEAACEEAERSRVDDGDRLELKALEQSLLRLETPMEPFLRGLLGCQLKRLRNDERMLWQVGALQAQPAKSEREHRLGIRFRSRSADLDDRGTWLVCEAVLSVAAAAVDANSCAQ